MARYPKELKKATNLAKSSVRAGKSKSDYSGRKAQNKGVKDGTIRLGKSGKTYNVYDAKTATWKRGVVKTSTSSKPMTGRGGYGSSNKPKSTGKGHYTGATTGNLAPGQPTIGSYFKKVDSDRKRRGALGAAKVTAKYGKTGARAQSAVYRAERRKKRS